MKVRAFNIKKGVYQFTLNEVNTGFHAHPAVEIILSKQGNFSIETQNASFQQSSFAVINSNISHRVLANNCTINLLMIECSPSVLQTFLKEFNIKIVKGVFVEKSIGSKSGLLESILKYCLQNTIARTDDNRVESCLQHFNDTPIEYKEMMETLKSKTNLSESRLSHLFKEEIGISLKKFLVWNRLKKAFALVLSQRLNLYEASLQSGFYDQAHLSKAFKQMLGLNPSEMYNSRTLQDS